MDLLLDDVWIVRRSDKLLIGILGDARKILRAFLSTIPIGNGFAQDLRPFLPAVNLFLIAPDGDVGMTRELCLKPLDER